jgi:hypothetical protein
MEKMDGKTMDIVADNVGKLKELFPEAFTEDGTTEGTEGHGKKIDFEVLKELLGDYVTDKDERYSFTWNGKSKARMIAQTPSTGTLRNRNSDVNVNQHNRLHPYYLIYIENDGQVITDHTQVKSLLDLVRSSCKGLSKPISPACKLFNAQTGDGRNMTRYSDLLGQAIRSMVEVKEDKDIDSLFSGVCTTALVDTIKGLDDFELIAFLVIQEDK